MSQIFAKYIDLNLFSGSAETLRTLVGGYYDLIDTTVEEEQILDYIDLSGIEIEDSDSGDAEILISDSPVSKIITSYQKVESTSEDTLLTSYKVPIRTFGNPDVVLTDAQWAAFFGEVDQKGESTTLFSTAMFDDHAFERSYPYTKYEQNLLEPKGYDCEAIEISYNYSMYLSEYEDYVNNQKETDIPNAYFIYYTVNPEPEAAAITVPSDVQSFVDLNGSLEASEVSSLLSPISTDILPPTSEVTDFPSSVGSYLYKDLNRNLREYLTSSLIVNDSVSMGSRADNLLIDAGGYLDSAVFFDAEDHIPGPVALESNVHVAYPYYIQIKIPSVTRADEPTLKYKIIENSFEQRFLKLVKESFSNDLPDLQPSTLSFATNKEYYSTSEDVTEAISTIQNTETTEYRVLNFMDLLAYSYNNYASQTDDCIFVGGKTALRDATFDSGTTYRYANTISTIKMINSTVAYLKNDSDVSKINSLGDLYNMSENKHIETLVYRIEKAGNQGTIQNFWFTNMWEEEDPVFSSFDFYDTQVKYGEEYTYSIYAYVLVVGVKYQFSDLRVTRQIGSTDVGGYCLEFYSPDSGSPAEQLYSEENISNLTEEYEIEFPSGESTTVTLPSTDRNILGTNAQITSEHQYLADFYLNYEPTIKIVELPIMTKTLRVLDHPPSNLEIDPYQIINDSQQIAFNLTYQGFAQMKFPTPISEQDLEYMTDYHNANDMLSTDLPEKGSVSSRFAIEVYRLGEKPTSIDKFRDNLYETIRLQIPEELYAYEDSYSLATFVDTIKTNTKYYYLFRVINDHFIGGYLSNVYVAELISDGGYKYAEFSVLYESELDPDEPKFTPFKAFKKLIELKPNIAHLALNTDDINYEDTSYNQIGNLTIGESDLEDPIWDKTFKLRLTSKKTGKKIDLNITYNLESD